MASVCENFKHSIFVIVLNAIAVGIYLLFQVSPALAGLRASNLELSTDRERTLVSLRLDAEPQFRWFQLGSPYRLVVDLPQTAFAIEHGKTTGAGLVEGIRYGDAGGDRSRLILSSGQPFAVEKIEVAQAEEGFKLLISLKKSTAADFHDALADQIAATGAIAPAQEPAPAGTTGKFKIVIDPGHGGIDGGAEGRNGTVEKEVTLTFARDLEARLKENPGYEVYMTRTDDRFLRLDERVEFARSKAANLFISIHADTIRFKGLRGATVYTGSDTASDAESEALADRENLSDQLAGMPVLEQNHEVADILYDFVLRETQGFSTRLAGHLVQRLSKTVGVINNPHRHARFRVLRAPDVPSVLIELGYLSNDHDEKSLRDPVWRAKAAEAIGGAIDEYAAARGSKAVSQGAD